MNRSGPVITFDDFMDQCHTAKPLGWALLWPRGSRIMFGCCMPDAESSENARS